ncbi:hypothetical protein V5O48_002371 [Marasmius crinis-equi]|uniref:Glutathione S-transferase n=1 Tax=Marasmius crinis-equi TaxID=585013 RepID=A0ABR3FVP0_9AGAR
MAQQITLYTAKICPYAQRVEIALYEAKVEYTRYEIDLQNKPVWFQPKVNPASKVPAIAYGGPTVPPDQPSDESVKLAESHILVEFIADLFPNSGILPSDPVERAKARFFIDTFTTKLAPAYVGFFLRGEPFEGVLKGFEALQALLPPEDKGKYAIGNQFSIADIAVAPFAARLETALPNDLGLIGPGEGKRLWDVFQKDARFERFRRYARALFERESFKQTYYPEYIKEAYAKRFAAFKAQRNGAATQA